MHPCEFRLLPACTTCTTYKIQFISPPKSSRTTCAACLQPQSFLLSIDPFTLVACGTIQLNVKKFCFFSTAQKESNLRDVRKFSSISCKKETPKGQNRNPRCRSRCISVAQKEPGKQTQNAPGAIFLVMLHGDHKDPTAMLILARSPMLSWF